MTPQERKNFESIRDNVHSEPMTQVETMKLALEALELAKNSHGMMLLSDPPQEAWKTYRVDDAIKKSTTALRQAIEQAQQMPPSAYSNTHQPEQEPVAWIHEDERIGYKTLEWKHDVIGYRGVWKKTPLYTSPPQRQPLTDEQIEVIAEKVANGELVGIVQNYRVRLARAIEAAHGIKE